MIFERQVLVTGGAGFIGSNFCRYLFNRYPSYRIVAFDALTYAGNVDNFSLEMRDSPRFEFVYGNVCNTAQIAELLDTGIDTIVHMAAETHVTRSIYDSKSFFETDVLGTASVATAASRYRRQLDRFIHVSSSEVYGTCRNGVQSMAENHPLEPCSPYASAKVGADRLVYSYWKTYGIPIVIARPFNNYGPRQHLEKAIPRFITSALLNEPLTIHGTGRSARDWLYVQDTCQALDTLLKAPLDLVVGEAFNIGTGVDVDVETVARKILSFLGRDESLLTWIGDRPGQVELHRADVGKMRNLLGWKHAVDLDEGLRRTIEWYVNNEQFWRRQMWMRRIKIETTAGREWH